MSATTVLREAKKLVTRAHTPVQLAVDAHGRKVRPLDPAAVAWSSTGAVGKVAPWMSATDPRVWFDLTPDGEAAMDLLNHAARLQGYRLSDAPITLVDADGLSAVLRAFGKAILLAPDDHRRTRRGAPAGTGSQPRGSEAAT